MTYPRIIFDSDNFTSFQKNALITLLKNDDLQMEESEVLDKVILWGKAKTPNLPPDIKDWTNENFNSLKATLKHCLSHIRYFQIPGKDVLKKIKPYRSILEENLWMTLSQDLKIQIGSRDGFASEVFHKLCDNLPRTVVAVKINNTNEILGGYNPLIWKVDGGRVEKSQSTICYGGITYGPWFSGNDFGMGNGSDPKR
ncbi:hypothetical protein C2G38_2039944 [Gigaspora rosea]|uniref:TLDc domain-containing protein n=1 Tax=Gigaspora rosea TaxID=44941 RepID=A0A397UZC6_9GLOM|nr:hypothetical protein C2G38_2039944 [Gigaspora rosea]